MSIEKNEAAIILITEGWPTAAACRFCGVNHGTLRSYIHRKGLYINKLRTSKVIGKSIHKDGMLVGIYTPKEVQNMANNLKSWKRVARVVGISHDAIRKWASDNGVYIRKKKAN